MIEQCGHAECGFGSRAAYCFPEAAQPAGDMSVVIDVLDALLYEKQDAPSDAYQIRADATGLHASRSLTFLSAFMATEGDMLYDPAPVIETSVAISHAQDRTGASVYDIGVAWSVHQRGVTPNKVLTTYHMEEDSEGYVRATITTPSLMYEDGTSLPTWMTPYDCEQLFALLEQANKADNVALQHNRLLETLESS